MLRIKQRFESQKHLELVLALVIVALCIALKQYSLAAVFVFFWLKLFKRETAFLVDSEALIDGRALDLCDFLDRTIIIPRFVLEKVQKISEPLSQKRASRALEKLQELRKKKDVYIEETRFSDEVSDRLRFVKLARKHSCTIVSANSELVVQLKKQRVRALNVNQLASLLVKNVIPGDQFKIIIEKPGRETSQGVGFLEDGSIVVVEDARLDIGKQIEIVVTNTINQKQGRVVFARKS